MSLELCPQFLRAWQLNPSVRDRDLGDLLEARTTKHEVDTCCLVRPVVPAVNGAALYADVASLEGQLDAVI